MLYVPGNRAAMVKDAHIYRPDTLMFDLEDSVPYTEKDSARMLVYHALRAIDYEGVETAVRINGLDTPYGLEDIEAMVRARPDIIRIPKTDTAESVREIEVAIGAVERTIGIPVGTIKLFAAIETPLGVMNAPEIARASDRLVGIALGAEDLVTNLGTTRSEEGIELLYARSRILFAARAAGIHAVDTVYSDVCDDDGFVRETRLIKQLGFDGKSVVQPHQIELAHKIFTPTPDEVRSAERTLTALRAAEERGSGVTALDGKMIDKPMLARAQRILELAIASGLEVNRELM